MTEVVKLPQWKCHKVVSAAKIERVWRSGADGSGTLTLLLEERGEVRSHTSVDMPADWMERFNPEPGGYYVVYEDGYCSFSPEKAFEEGYTRIEG